MPPDPVGRALAGAQAVEQGFGAPLQKAFGGIQVVVGDLVIAARNVQDQKATTVLGLDRGPDIALVKFPTPAGYLFGSMSWIGHRRNYFTREDDFAL